MARQVLPIVGAVIGAYFGNPQLGYAIGALHGPDVDPEEPAPIGGFLSGAKLSHPLEAGHEPA